MPYITDDDVSPLIQTVAWFTFAAILFCIAARAATKAAAIRCINLDDWLIMTSALFAVGQVISVVVQTANGFGKPYTSLDEAQVQRALKAAYSAEFLYVLSLVFAKSAVLAFVRLISPVRHHHYLIAAFQILLIATGFVSIFVIAFQCDLPRPWDYVNGMCIQRYTWWFFFEVLNAVTDVALILLPAYVIVNTRVRARRKAFVVAIFGIRLSAVAAEICKLVYWSRYHDAQDPFLNLWRVIVCNEVIQCVSIVSACALYIRPFLRLFESGFFHLDDLKRKGVMSPFTLADRSVISHMRVVNS